MGACKKITVFLGYLMCFVLISCGTSSSESTDIQSPGDLSIEIIGYNSATNELQVEIENTQNLAGFQFDLVSDAGADSFAISSIEVSSDTPANLYGDQVYIGDTVNRALAFLPSNSVDFADNIADNNTLRLIISLNVNQASNISIDEDSLVFALRSGLSTPVEYNHVTKAVEPSVVKFNSKKKS